MTPQSKKSKEIMRAGEDVSEPTDSPTAPTARWYFVGIKQGWGGFEYYRQRGFDAADAIQIVLAINRGAVCVSCEPVAEGR